MIEQRGGNDPMRDIFEGVLPLINKLHNGGREKMPVVIINPWKKRADEGQDPTLEEMAEQLIYEAQELEKKSFPTSFKEGPACAVITSAASPHTSLNLHIDGRSIPDHLIVWFFGENGERKNLLDLTGIPEEELRQYLQLIAKATSSAVLFSKEHVETEEQVKTDPDIYGLIGYTREEKDQIVSANGLTKGCQSNPHGHLNVVWHREKEEIGEKDYDLGSMLKVIGPMNSIVMERWGELSARLLDKFLRENNIEIKNIGLEKERRIEGSKVFYEDGFRINFSEGKTLEDSLAVLVQSVSLFEKIYDGLLLAYDSFYSGSDSKENILAKFIKRAGSVGLSDEVAEEMFDFALSFKPTYGQLDSWLENEETSDERKVEFEKLKERYKKARDRLSEVKRWKSLDWLLLAQQLGLPEGEWPELVWPQVLSMVYRIHYKVVDNQIIIDGLSLYPRFMGHKGLLEGIFGMPVVRDLPS